MKMYYSEYITMTSIRLHTLYIALRDRDKKGKYSGRGWKRAYIRRLRRLQHLEAILLLCCGQVRCTELNSTTTMAKRAAETKEGYPCFLTPSLLADQSPGAESEQHQATSEEARGMTNSKSQHIYTYCMTTAPNAQAHTFSYLHGKNNKRAQTPKRIYQWADGVGCFSWPGRSSR